MHQPTVTKLADFVCRAFFAQFVSTTALNNPTPLDLLSGVELARSDSSVGSARNCHCL